MEKTRQSHEQLSDDTTQQVTSKTLTTNQKALLNELKNDFTIIKEMFNISDSTMLKKSFLS